MDDLTRAYQVLGLTPPVSAEQVKRAYRDLVKVWHPDRFGHDERLQQAAQAKLKEINGAYEVLLAGLFAEGTTPAPEPAPDSSPNPPPDPAGRTRGGYFNRSVVGLTIAVVLLLALVAGVAWRAWRSPAGTTASASHPASKASSGPTPEMPPGKLIASQMLTVADDFVVEVYQNGRRLPDEKRNLVGETHGATTEQLTLAVHEGDWLVFNVVNDRFRWGGACYFGAAGMDSRGNVTFVSERKSGQWSSCDDPGAVPRFIAEADYLAADAVHEIPNVWSQGDGELSQRLGKWTGEPIWGTNRNTWLKYRAPRASPAP